MTAAEVIGHWSPTSITRYASCPGSWARHYRYDERGDECAIFLRGRLIHAIAADYNRHCLEIHAASDVNAMHGIVERHCLNTHLPAEVDYIDVREVCERLAYNQNLDVDHLVDIEQSYYFKVNGYSVVGRPDLVFVVGNTGYVPDYKTGWYLPSADDIKASLALRVYAAAVMHEYEQVDCVKVAVICPRLNKTSDPHVYWRDDLPAIEGELWRRINHIDNADDYPYTPGSYCDVCEFAASCEHLAKAIVNAGNKVGPVVRADQAADLVAELVSLKWRTKAITTALKPYTVNHGPVASSDTAYGPRELVGTTYPARAVFDLFDGTDVDPWTLLKVDGSALKRAMKAEKQLRDDVLMLAETDTRIRTDLHKVTVPEGD